MLRISLAAATILALSVGLLASLSPAGSATAGASTSGARFTGIICLDADCMSAAAGKQLIAKIGDVECATTTIFAISDGPTQTRYDITVPSDADVPGCGTELAIVEFSVDGRAASNGGFWHAGETQELGNWVGEDFAAFSGALSRNGQPILVTGGGGFYVGPTVRAYIGGVLCGEKQAVQGVPGQAHYSLLVIPSSRPGCEQNDATVTFTVDGVTADQTDRNVYGFLNRDLNITVTNAAPAGFLGSVCLDANCESLSGTVIAKIGSTECASVPIAFVVDGPVTQAFYDVSVPSADEKPGCGTEGATVTFVVNGVTATTTGTWQAGRSQLLDIVAGQPFAAFSGKLSLNGAPLPREPQPILKAFINGVECGSRRVSRGFFPPTVTTVEQYVWLIVLSAQGRPGCGTEGAKITFTLDGIPTAQTATWTAGFHTLDLGATKITAIHNTGGPPSSADNTAPLLGAAITAAGAVLLLLSRQRRKRNP